MMLKNVCHLPLDHAMLSAAYHPATNQLAIGLAEGTIRILTLPTLHTIATHTHTAPYAQVEGLAWDTRGSILFSTSVDGYRVLVWNDGLDHPPHVLYHGPATDDDEEGYAVWDGFTPGVLTMDPTGQFLACGDLDGRIKIWRWMTHDLYADIAAHTSYVSGLDFHPDGNHFVSTSHDGTIGFWSVDGHGSIAVAEGLEQLQSAAWSPDGKYVLCAGYAPGRVRLLKTPWPCLQRWDPLTLQQTGAYDCPTPWGERISIHPSRPLAAVGHTHHRISIWNTDSWIMIDDVATTIRTTSYLAWTRDGSSLISGGYGIERNADGIELWELCR